MNRDLSDRGKGTEELRHSGTEGENKRNIPLDPPSKGELKMTMSFRKLRIVN